MPSTITSFTTFVAGTKARATEVNANFSNFRGDLIPVNADTASSSDNTHNLGLSSHQWKDFYYAGEVYWNGVKQGLNPVGTVIATALDSAPSGYLYCDGSSISRSTYSDLFTKLTNGAETAPCFGYATTTHFYILDARGKFIRGVDGGAGNDPDATTTSRTAQGTNGSTGDSIGSIQADATARPNTNFTTDSQGSHTHSIGLSTGGGGSAKPSGVFDTDYDVGSDSTGSNGAHTHSITGGGDNETRPVNVNLKYYIKY